MTPEETKAAAEVMLAWAEGKKVEFRSIGGGAWHETGNPVWEWKRFEYRIAIEKPSINWDHVDRSYNFLSIDKDNRGFLYTQKPYLCNDRTYWRGGGTPISACTFISLNPGNCDWKDSLIIRPGHEEE